MATRRSPVPLRRRPRVSVVVPCYRYGHFLPDCVRSILEQPGVDPDVLIVDDASPDDSAKVARELSNADGRVRVLEHTVNRGHIATYNDGLAVVDGDYVVLLSADDLLAPGALARATALLEASPETGMVYGHSPVFSGQPPTPRRGTGSWTIWSGQEWIERVCHGVNNPVTTPDVVLRTSLMRDLGGYDARLPHSADYLLWLRAASRAGVGRINGVDQGYYRAHAVNMHTEQYGVPGQDFAERVRTFDLFFDEDGDRVRDADQLRARVRRGLAREALTIAGKSEVLSHYRNAPVDELVALARALAPPEEDPALWHAYQRRVAADRGGLTWTISRRADIVVDDLHRRVRWRRWRRSGLYSPLRTI